MDSVDLREVNPHLLENLIQASEQEQIVVGEDIYDTSGIKLLANGYPIETSTREKLLFRTLQKPLETSLRAQNLDIADAIRSEVNWLLEQHPAVSLMFAGLDNEGRDIALTIEGETIGIAQMLKLANLVESTSEDMRAIQQGGLKLDSVKAEDKNLQLSNGAVLVAQVGKRKFSKITIF